MSAADFYKMKFFKKLREVSRVLIGLDPDQDQHCIGLDLLVQTVGKGFQQMTKVTTSKEIVIFVVSLLRFAAEFIVILFLLTRIQIRLDISCEFCY